MASSAQPQPQPQPQQQQQHQQQQLVVAAPVEQTEAQSQQPKPTRVSLSYEEISKLFSLPIAEAASILGNPVSPTLSLSPAEGEIRHLLAGVCTSVLKRICRSHGIVRWPYRKLVSGKAGEDTKSAEREKAKGLLESSKIAKQKALSSSGLSTTSSGAFQAVAKSQQGSSKAGQVSPPGKQNASSGSITQTKVIPTYMDDFKYGFPSYGLSSETMRWWGTDSHTEATPVKDENGEAPESTNEASKGMTDDEMDWGAEETEADSAVTNEPSAQLCSLRRKAVNDGRKLLTGKACRGQELCRLNKRQKMALAQVFGASLPEKLRSKLE